ncbi:hypothetical protein GCM10009117_16120 [Gangjinia marincola]|uniref:GIY-YIG domain-containing protein n=2 Tax=Gangjinia marincola TaxID=578463 RepID=A0ABN1MH59_9FLAO
MFDIFYKGYTGDLEKRLLEHNNDKGRYTKNKGPWKIVYTETFSNKTEALKRERSLKKYSKKQIYQLISSLEN